MAKSKEREKKDWKILMRQKKQAAEGKQKQLVVKNDLFFADAFLLFVFHQNKAKPTLPNWTAKDFIHQMNLSGEYV